MVCECVYECECMVLEGEETGVWERRASCLVSFVGDFSMRGPSDVDKTVVDSSRSFPRVSSGSNPQDFKIQALQVSK